MMDSRQPEREYAGSRVQASPHAVLLSCPCRPAVPEPDRHTCRCCCCCRTYATLVGKEGAGRARSRLEQVVSWVGGPTWEGLLVLDECHK
jgi:hypothetical protein